MLMWWIKKSPDSISILHIVTDMLRNLSDNMPPAKGEDMDTHENGAPATPAKNADQSAKSERKDKKARKKPRKTLEHWILLR